MAPQPTDYRYACTPQSQRALSTLTVSALHTKVSIQFSPRSIPTLRKPIARNPAARRQSPKPHHKNRRGAPEFKVTRAATPARATGAVCPAGKLAPQYGGTCKKFAASQTAGQSKNPSITHQNSPARPIACHCMKLSRVPNNDPTLGLQRFDAYSKPQVTWLLNLVQAKPKRLKLNGLTPPR